MVSARTTNGRSGSAVKAKGRVVPLRRRAASKPLPDVLHTEPGPAYDAELQAEAEWWDACAQTLSSEDAPFGFQEYQNERLTGDRDRRWYQTIADFGEFKKGCVLGAGPGMVESELLSKMPDLQLEVHDISSDSLVRLDARLEESFPGRVTFHASDLNFAELREDQFDLVVAQSSIHHILNLEHLAYQVNRALTPDGMFFMMDRVGESFYQFPEEKKRMFESFLATGPQGPQRKVYWPSREKWTYSPFEGVRSGEILDVFGRYLNEAHLRTASSLIELMLFVGPAHAPPGSRSLAERISGRFRRELFKLSLRVLGARALATRGEIARGQLLMQLDSLTCDSGALKPGLAFAVYRKRA
jgi:SAM-dependent methyltransferase